MRTSKPDFFRYVPIRPQDINWGLYVTAAGRTHVTPGAAYPAARHPDQYEFRWERGRELPEYQAIYVVRGEGQFESTPTGPVDVTAGSVILLFPDVWHRYRPRREVGWDEYWVGFHGPWSERLLRHDFFSPQRAVLRTGIAPSLLRPFKEILRLLEGERYGFPQILAAHTMEILAAIRALTPGDDQEPISRSPQLVTPVKDRLIADAIRIIWEYAEEPLTVEGLVGQLPASRRSLERRFQSELGRSIAEEITRCRLERATGLLARTRLSIKQVATAAGFASADTMGRVFQRTYHQSPREYRASSHGPEEPSSDT